MNIEVKLSKSYTAHAEVFSAVTMREPTFRDIYVDGLGLPQELQPTPSGGAMVVTNYEVIGLYINRLAVKPTAECLTELSAIDAGRLSKAVIGFFREAIEPKSTDDGSSSGSASTSTASAE